MPLLKFEESASGELDSVPEDDEGTPSVLVTLWVPEFVKIVSAPFLIQTLVDIRPARRAHKKTHILTFSVMVHTF